jgi:hypothetical protein
MKTRTAISLFSVLFFMVSFTSFAQTDKFSGEWKLNTQKTNLGETQLYMFSIRILIRNDSLLTTRTYKNVSGEEYPFDENLSLKGTEGKIVIYDMPRTAKASCSDADGTMTFESTTTFNSNGGTEDLVMKESWKVENDGNTLTINLTSKSSEGEQNAVFYYDKVK